MINGQETKTVQFKQMGEVVAEDTQKQPRDPRQGEELKKVTVNVGLTKSLGNYEFLKVDCSFEDFCAADERKKMFGSLLQEATECVSHVVEHFPAYQRTFAIGTCVERYVKEGDRPATPKLKWILNEEMKRAFETEQYEIFSKALQDRKRLTENEAREAIWQLRNEEDTFLVQVLEESIDKRAGVGEGVTDDSEDPFKEDG